MYRMLIVEKEEGKEILNNILKYNYDLTYACSVDEAVLLLGQGGFDCLLVDVSIKSMDYISLLDYIADNGITENVPVVIATEENVDDIDECILSYDISEIIQKPYEAYMLTKRIDNIIRLFKQQMELSISNRELEQAYKNARDAVDIKSKFILNMSHDLRTPMNAIIGMTEMAKKYLDDKLKARECLDNLIAASDHLLDIINSILDMSNIEKGSMVNNMEECNLGQIVRDISVIIEQQCRKKELNYELTISNLEHEDILVDATRLKQVFINILGNAVKFTDSGGTVGMDINELRAEKEGYVRYEFLLHDNGRGMSEKFMKNMFVPFEREENRKGPYIEGTGLGLAITKSIVDSMNGDIEVESKEGLGTNITIRLELERAGGDYIDEEILKSAKVCVYDGRGGQGRKITEALGSLGIRAVCYDSIRQVTEHAAGCNIMFACSEGEDGHFADELRSVKDKIPGINIIHAGVRSDSGYDETNLYSEAVTQPFFMSELSNAVRNILGSGAVNGEVGYSFDGVRVLVVDDNSINRMIAREFLEAAGVECVEADCGRNAIDILENAEKGYYDMVLMDIQMPDIDGCKVTKIIRTSKKGYHMDIPVVAVTAEAFAEDRERAVRAGMNAYICKPFKRDELYQCIRTYAKDKIKAH